MPNRTRVPGRTTVFQSLSLLMAAAVTGGCGGGDGNYSDDAAPTVTLAAPSGAISRSVTLTATANDNRGVTQVEFLVDGAVVNTDTAAPFSYVLDTANLADGAHSAAARATDAAGNAATSSSVALTVLNNVSYRVALAGDQEFPATGSTATGDATLQVNLVTGAVAGSLVLAGMTTTAAHVHDGYAGTNGPVQIGLDLRAGTTDTFDVPASSTLTAGQVDKLLEGALYLNAHSAAFAAGEVRGQIVPEHVSLVFVDLKDDEVIESVRSLGSGRAALTVNRSSGAAVAHVVLQQLDGVTAVHLDQGAAGTTGTNVLALAEDPADATRWSATSTALTQAAVDALAQGFLHFDVDTAAHAGGELRGQALPAGVEVGIARLDGAQVVPAVDSSLSGMGAITVNSNSGTATVHVNTTGSPNPTGAQLHSAIGGREGPSLATLTQDGSNPAHWSVASAPLSGADISAFRQGGLYVEMPGLAHADGELRGQLAPPGVLFIANSLDGSQEVPAKSTPALGSVAVTIDRASRTLELQANTSGVDDASAAHIHTGHAGENGPVAIGLTKDTADATHWSASGIALTEQQLDAIEHGAAYVNVHTPANPGGEIRGQLVSDRVQVEFDTLSGDEESPAVTTAATGTAATTVDFAARTVSIHVHATGVDDATDAHIHRASAGTNGSVLVGLVKDAVDPGHWSVEDHLVTATDLADFMDGLWYVNVHTPAHPTGEIRAQIGAATVPPGDTTAPTATLGAVAATVSGTITLTATAQDDVGVTNVRFLLNGATELGSDASDPYSISWDTTTVPNGQVMLTAEARDAAGNFGLSTAFAVTASNSAAVTLAQLQTSIFAPKCSGCHTGGGGGLPGSMNLSSANASFAALVNVASLQQPALMRVNPGAAESSYIIHKLEGRAGIAGVRMPQGGPFLSTAEIDAVKAWINAGATNN